VSEMKRRLMLAAVGTDYRAVMEGPRSHPAVVTVEVGVHATELARNGVVGEDSLVFAPQDDPPGIPGVVTYRGSVWNEGDELNLGGSFYLQAQKYAICEYMSVVGPTVIRVKDEEDFAIFLRDADIARESGAFPIYLANPLVFLADIPALGEPWKASGPDQRIHVRGNGEVSVSAFGKCLGTTDTPLSTLKARWEHENGVSQAPCAVALGEAVGEGVRSEGVRDRPWLGRYLAALNTIRQGLARGMAGLRVSGFGGYLAPGEGDLTDPANVIPVVSWNEDKALLFDPRSNRAFGMGTEAAALVELLLRFGSPERASESAPLEALRQAELQLAGFGISPVDVTGGEE